MSVSSLRTPKACLERAIVFKADAEALLAIENEWFAVAYFYAAFHAVRSALMVDPVFDDPNRLQRFGSHWIPDDRFSDRHKSRRGAGPVKPGVNELVESLYPSIAVEYVQLHSASVAVRYGLGLSSYDRTALVAGFEKVITAVTKMSLVAQEPS